MEVFLLMPPVVQDKLIQEEAVEQVVPIVVVEALEEMEVLVSSLSATH
jgi:hypothetical protein